MKRTTKTTTTVTTETTDDGPRQTLVTFLLDRTGSMHSIKADTIGGFNAYLDTLEREAGDLVRFTLLTFDSVAVDKLYVGAKLNTVARLTNESYQPRANTPLYDAAVKAIKATESQVLAHPGTPPRVVVVIQTDGEENCSVEYNQRDLAALIKARSAEGWEFVYLGANVDAYKTASAVGINVANTVSYQGNLSSQLFAASARNTRSFATGQSMNMGYSAQQKADAGDLSSLGNTGGLAGSTAGALAGLGGSGLAGTTAPKTSSKKPPIVDDINLTK